MKKQNRVFFGIILGIFSLPFIGLGLYDVIDIRPKLPAIHAILQNASPQDRNPPMMIQNLIDASFNFNHQAKNAYITQRIADKVDSTPLTTGARHFRNLMWQLLLPLHFDKSQMYGFYSTMTNFVAYQGLNNFAIQHFGKPLDQLTPQQSATTVAIVHSPTRFLSDNKGLDERANYLLQKLKTP